MYISSHTGNAYEKNKRSCTKNRCFLMHGSMDMNCCGTNNNYIQAKKYLNKL